MTGTCEGCGELDSLLCVVDEGPGYYEEQWLSDREECEAEAAAAERIELK